MIYPIKNDSEVWVMLITNRVYYVSSSRLLFIRHSLRLQHLTIHDQNNTLLRVVGSHSETPTINSCQQSTTFYAKFVNDTVPKRFTFELQIPNHNSIIKGITQVKVMFIRCRENFIDDIHKNCYYV